jgi:hypothetical protein
VNCMECALAEPLSPEVAIGCCTHCGAGVCLQHAHVAMIRPQVHGVVPHLVGGRRLTCTVCAPMRPAPPRRARRELRVPRSGA